MDNMELPEGVKVMNLSPDGKGININGKTIKFGEDGAMDVEDFLNTDRETEVQENEEEPEILELGDATGRKGDVRWKIRKYKLEGRCKVEDKKYKLEGRCKVEDKKI